MNQSQRDEMLCHVLHTFLYADTYETRYGLYTTGESLVTEYKDLDVGEIRQEIAENCSCDSCQEV